MQKSWWKELIVYQIYPRSFYDSNDDGIGDLKGVTEKIPYLKNLGVTALWLSPYFKSPNDDNGYDISDYRDIMDDFGTMDDWNQMITVIHENGMKLIMDLVVNHSSDEHQWFIESRKSKDSKFRDYYIWKDGKGDNKPPNNWLSVFGGSAWEFDEKTGQYYLHIFSKKQPDLNWENEALRNEIYDMMIFWMDKGVDGFRLDAIANLSKNQQFPDGDPSSICPGVEHYVNGPRLHEFLHEMNQKALSKYDAMTVGECFSTKIDEAIKYVKPEREELNMIFQFNVMQIDTSNKRHIPRKWNWCEVKDIIRDWQKAMEESGGWNSVFLSNHDFPRQVSRFGNDSTPFLRVVSAKMLATMNFTLQGTVYVYQGEEIGMTNVHFENIKDYRDIDTLNLYKEWIETKTLNEEEALKAIHLISRDNARTPMQWNGNTQNAGFSKAPNTIPWMNVNPNYKDINVEDSLKDENSVLHYYMKLIQIHKDYKDVIVYGKFEDYYPSDSNTYIYTRRNDSNIMFVTLNLTQNEVPLKVPENVDVKGSKILISN